MQTGKHAELGEHLKLCEVPQIEQWAEIAAFFLEASVGVYIFIYTHMCVKLDNAVITNYSVTFAVYHDLYTVFLST